jgi:hypothetical protein
VEVVVDSTFIIEGIIVLEQLALAVKKPLVEVGFIASLVAFFLAIEQDLEEACLMVGIHLGCILGFAMSCFFVGKLLGDLVFLLSFLWVHLLGFITRV